VPPAAGGVATWLPDGRWLAAHELDESAAGGELDRGRGRRRVALVKIVARLAGWPRRVLAGALLLTAVLVALRPDAAPAVPPASLGTVPVVVVARDLPAGALLATRDVRTASLPRDAVPAGAVREVPAVLGRVVAGPVRRGEPITDARLVGPGLTAGLGPDESAAVPVRLADPQAAALVRPGDRVDVLGTPVEPSPTGVAPPASDAALVAGAVRVLAVLRGRDPADGVLLVVAAAPAAARRLAGAAARYRLTVTVRPP